MVTSEKFRQTFAVRKGLMSVVKWCMKHCSYSSLEESQFCEWTFSPFSWTIFLVFPKGLHTCFRSSRILQETRTTFGWAPKAEQRCKEIHHSTSCGCLLWSRLQFWLQSWYVSKLWLLQSFQTLKGIKIMPVDHDANAFVHYWQFIISTQPHSFGGAKCLK